MVDVDHDKSLLQQRGSRTSYVSVKGLPRLPLLSSLSFPVLPRGSVSPVGYHTAYSLSQSLSPSSPPPSSSPAPTSSASSPVSSPPPPRLWPAFVSPPL